MDNYTKVRDEAQGQWGKLAKVDSELNQSAAHMLSNEALIDFENELTKFRDRTEFSLPYTVLQIEDVMFIDQQRLVSLEYIFYQTGDARYSKLRKNKTNKNFLGSENFIESSKDGLLNKDYKEPPVSYHDTGKADYLAEHDPGHRPAAAAEAPEGDQADHDQGENKDDQKEEPVLPFMDTELKDAKVEALISLWKIDTGGQLTKAKEISFGYDSEFKPTIKG